MLLRIKKGKNGKHLCGDLMGAGRKDVGSLDVNLDTYFYWRG